MQPSRFDTVSRLFATRRTSRRTALAALSGSIVATSLAPVAAQDASPVPAQDASSVPSDAANVPFMFVQTFGDGSLAPKEGDPGVLILTADHLAGQTLYFSDRPERIVGMVATERFLGTGPDSEGLGFTPPDPPNAALVFGNGDEMVVELIDPAYDPATGLATYTVRVLDDVEQVDIQLEQQPLSAAEAPRQFEAASLFIDDCPNGSIYCITPETINPNNNPPETPSQQIGMNVDIGFCYDAAAVCCWPCGGPGSVAYQQTCNSTFPACNNNCTVSVQETWVCNF